MILDGGVKSQFSVRCYFSPLHIPAVEDTGGEAPALDTFQREDDGALLLWPGTRKDIGCFFGVTKRASDTLSQALKDSYTTEFSSDSVSSMFYLLQDGTLIQLQLRTGWECQTHSETIHGIVLLHIRHNMDRRYGLPG